MADIAPLANSGIAGRIVRAAGAQGINQLARIVQLFLLVPICLGAWGTAIYEDWLLLNSVAAFLILADFGMVQYTTVKLIEVHSRGDQELVAREWSLALGVFAALCATLLCLLGLCWLEPAWISFIPSRQMPANELASLAVLLALTQVLSILINLGLGAYRAHGDLSRSYHVSSILVGLQTAGVALPAWLGAGPAGAADGTCMVTGAMLAVMVADLRLRYPGLRWKPAWPSFGGLHARVREAVGYLASPIAITIMLNGPNLILAQCGAPEGAIALFTTSRTVAGVARQLPYQFAHPAGVELAALMARGDRAGLGRLYKSASWALATVVGVLSGGTIVAAPLVMALWTRGKVTYDPVLMMLLLGTTAICAPSQVAYTLLWYGGFPGRLIKALLLSTGLAMGLAMLFSPLLETRGAALGIGTGEIAGVAVYLAIAVDRQLGRKAGDDLLRNFSTTVLAFSSSAAFGYLVHRLIQPRGWLGLAEFGAAWGIPAGAALCWMLLSAPQKLRMAHLAANFFRSRRVKRA